MKSPEQALYDAVYKASQGLGYKTYDYRPADDVGYPFVEVTDTMTINEANKSRLFGYIPVTVNIWGRHTERKKVSDMALEIFNNLLKVSHAEGYNVRLNPNASNTRMLMDTSTSTPLWRAIVELEFKFN